MQPERRSKLSSPENFERDSLIETSFMKLSEGISRPLSSFFSYIKSEVLTFLFGEASILD